MVEHIKAEDNNKSVKQQVGTSMQSQGVQKIMKKNKKKS